MKKLMTGLLAAVVAVGTGMAGIPPAVIAGADQVVAVSVAAMLDGSVADDGLPIPPGAPTLAWTKVSGAGTVTFDNAAAAQTTATFSEAGVYVLRLTADDGAKTGSDTVTIICQAAPAPTGVLRLATFSDPHYFATNLLVADGVAFQTYLAQDRKLIAESAAITKEVVDQIIARNPNFVLVTGDLTKDGELASHLAFSSELARLEAAGAQVLVIPGNHDIDNPMAAAYDGSTVTPVPSVSPAQFKSIYGAFGYDLASAMDPSSVGYAADLTPSLRMVCMDSTQYGNRTYGSFTNGTRLAWITNQIASAHADGKLVIGMMHHGLMEHFPGQKALFSEYVINDYQTLAPLFAGLGMKAVFTGHFHANDIVAGTFGGRTIYDIETGSTVTWPCPYRVMELDVNSRLAMTTHHIEAIDYALGAAPDFQTYANDYLTSGMLDITTYTLQLQFGLDAGTAAYLAPTVSEALVAHYAGDETFSAATPTTQAIVLGMLASSDPLQWQLGGAVYSILTDPAPFDNDGTLDLETSIIITAPADGVTEPVENASVLVSVDALGIHGALTYANTTMGVSTLSTALTVRLPLQAGVNHLVVSGVNEFGGSAAATVTVTRASLVDRQLTLGLMGTLSVPNAEIVAYDAASKRAVVTCQNQGIRFIDLSAPFAPVVLGGALTNEMVNSVAVKNGLVAVAVENAVGSNPGEVVFLDMAGVELRRITVGIQPDMLTFTPDGSKVLTANEAETGDHTDYGTGSISVIDLSGGVMAASVTNLDFYAFDSQTNALRDAGVRIFPGRLPSVDFEPEYIAVSADGRTAMVTLQENNALARVDLTALTITEIVPLGLKDHILPGNELDASDKDSPGGTGMIRMLPWPVFGMYMPDAIASFSAGGQTYYVTANEGDIRDTGTDESRIKSLTLDASVFPNATLLKLDANLGRLTASKIDGDLDKDGDIDRLQTYGTRSFTIWDASGALVYDSGNDLALRTAAETPTLFNANDGLVSKFDQRSDDKGCEPEGVTMGTIGGCTYAFVALERAGGGIMTYDVTCPMAPLFMQYARRDGDVAPEGVNFVSAAESPNGKPLLLVAHEESQTLTVYEIEPGAHLRTRTESVTVPLATETYEISGTFGNMAGALVWSNAQSGVTGTASMGDGVWQARVPLIAGHNVFILSGVNAEGTIYTSTVTIIRQPGMEIQPTWSTAANGAVHLSWTTNDWYQFQSGNICLPGTFLFRDPFGGDKEPGDGDPRATTLGATHVRYDAADDARYVVVEDDADFSVRVPCYQPIVTGVPVMYQAWVQVTYWDDQADADWVQNWELFVTPTGGSSTTPVLMGRVHGLDGLITDAYTFTITGENTDFTVSFSAVPALTALNPAFVSEVTVDTLMEVGATMGSAADRVLVAVDNSGLVGNLTFRNEATGQEIVVPAYRGRANMDLIYGINVITVTGVDAQGKPVATTVTYTRESDEPADGTQVLPSWDFNAATGAVHIAWTVDDWYQFQRDDTCLPGTFLFRDPFGGEIAPGNGEPEAITWWGDTSFRYDALDGSRSAMIEADDDFSLWVPCYNSDQTGVVPTSQQVWVQVSYWAAPNNPEWVQDWMLTAFAQGAGASASMPTLVGRSRSDDDIITEAYAFTITGDTEGFYLDFAANPELAAINPAYVSAITVDMWSPTEPLINSPADGATLGSSNDGVTLTFRTTVFAGTVTGVNSAFGLPVTAPASAGAVTLPLVYGLNTLTLSGLNAAGEAISVTITVTREAPTPVNGTTILPAWDVAVDEGTVQVAWTTNDWYQFQSEVICLPGSFLFRDPFGGATEPGDGDPRAATLGATHFRYDAGDATRTLVVESDGDFSVRVPCYEMPAMSALRSHEVWVRVSYWDAPGNPAWVQGWELAVAPASVSAPVLMGRTHSEDGLITEAYSFTVVGDADDLTIGFQCDPALAVLNPAYITEVVVDTRVTAALQLSDPAQGTTVGSTTETTTVSVNSQGMSGNLTFRNGNTGEEQTASAGVGSATMGLVYGLNVITVTGIDSQGRTVTATVTVTREAPTPVNGTGILPDWSVATDNGTVHVAWTTNDWYQFQSELTCLPGTFLFRDPFGGTTEPGDGDPRAATLGATHFRYDAGDDSRTIVVEDDGDFSVRVPCYDMPEMGAPRTHEVWVRVSYWDAPGNPSWVQGWELAATSAGGSATAPMLMGRTHADGLITEAYSFTVVGDGNDLTIGFLCDPALAVLNPAYITEVVVDTRVSTALTISAPVQDTTVSSTTASTTVAVTLDGVTGLLTFRNENTGETIQALASRGRASMGLMYGLNTITVTGTNSQGQAVTATVTITREASVPVNGENILPVWDSSVATGAVHVAWTTNDWYQFQSADTCLPGTFLYRDPFGGDLQPGNSDPDAMTLGATHFRYDAQDGSRYVVIEQDWDFSLWVPCYNSNVAGLPMNQQVWMRVSYWDAPGNPEWIQNWDIDTYAPGANVTSPVLMGRVRSANGLITEAYAFNVTGDTAGLFIDLAAIPTLSALNPANVSEIHVDVLAAPGVPAHRILTTVDGNGRVSSGSILLAQGASTNLVITAADWYRIHSLTTNSVSVSVAAGSTCYTQAFVNVRQDFANHVAFDLRTNSLNPDNVPTAWLVGFGKGENVPLVSSDRPISEKYALNINPYDVHTVNFGIEDFRLEGGFLDVKVKLLVDGNTHENINGYLQLDGRTTLEGNWVPVGETPVTGSVFSNGTHNYHIQTDTNRFFRAVVR